MVKIIPPNLGRYIFPPNQQPQYIYPFPIKPEAALKTALLSHELSRIPKNLTTTRILDLKKPTTQNFLDENETLLLRHEQILDYVEQNYLTKFQ